MIAPLPKRSQLVGWLLVACSVGSLTTGCQAIQLENRTYRMSRTLSDIQYRQVLDNLAMMANNPSSLPFFNVAATGKTTIQQSSQANGSLNWDLITAAPTGPLFLFNKTILDKESASLQYTQQNIDEWDTTPSLDPIQWFFRGKVRALSVSALSPAAALRYPAGRVSLG